MADFLSHHSQNLLLWQHGVSLPPSRSRSPRLAMMTGSPPLRRNMPHSELTFGGLWECGNDGTTVEWEGARDRPPDELRLVCIQGRNLIEVSLLGRCINLRVLCIARNFITDLAPLRPLVHLVKLDAHGNHLNRVPEESFWQGIPRLRALFLHDNAFESLKDVRPLGGCQALVMLTLCQSPVSLQENYRHYIINTIISLKALDRYALWTRGCSRLHDSRRPLSDCNGADFWW